MLIVMAVELDHFFILTDPDTRFPDVVSSIGLIEGSRNTHPGQGTANRRFFLANSTLEFLYVRDAEEAANGRGSRLRFVERSTSAKSSPFGLVFRVATGFTNQPFPGWRYCPEYFRENQCFQVGENSDLLEEPLCICMPIGLPQAEAQPKSANLDWNLSELRISVPVIHPSLTLEAISNCDGIVLKLNEPHRLEVIFNDGKEGESKSMNNEFPLVLRW